MDAREDPHKVGDVGRWRAAAGWPGRASLPSEVGLRDVNHRIEAILLEEIDRFSLAEHRVGLTQPEPGNTMTTGKIRDGSNPSCRASVDELLDRIDVLLRAFQKRYHLPGILPPMEGRARNAIVAPKLSGTSNYAGSARPKPIATAPRELSNAQPSIKVSASL